jgi:hypothetical protein
MKKDDYLTTMMQVPPKQRIAIVPFDQRTQREAFAVSPEGLKGVCHICRLVALLDFTVEIVEPQRACSGIGASSRRSKEEGSS